MSEENRKSVSYDELEQAFSAEGVSSEQTAKAWERLSASQQAEEPRSAIPSILTYFGAIGALVAMAWGMEVVYVDHQAQGTILLSLLYGAIFTGCGAWALSRGNRVAGGLLSVLAVFMVPFAVGSLLDLTHQRPGIDQAELITALATVAVGLGYTMWTRISFVIFPSLLAGAVAALNIGNLVGGYWFFNNADWSLTIYGLVAILGTCLVDGRTKEDYAGWGFAVGAISFWAGLSWFTKNEAGYALYAGVGLVSMLFVSVLLSRRIFALTGGFAVIMYLEHVLDQFFRNSELFPFVLAAFFLGVIILAEFYRRNVDAIEHAVVRLLGRDTKKNDNSTKQ